MVHSGDFLPQSNRFCHQKIELFLQVKAGILQNVFCFLMLFQLLMVFVKYDHFYK